ncbi:MAG: sigma-70 family RNA polymerase sigma factor [Candidatus Nanopelagicaceae bacterium]
MAEEKKLTVVELIASLPEEERIILMLYFSKNLSLPEIAERIGVPERAVSAVLASGRARLRESFDFPSSD